MTGICMAVTRRKQAELARLADAQEANQLKDQFLATLSHELRTPLNAILGWIQVLDHDLGSPARVRHAIEIIRRNAKLQAQLIEDILDVSRIMTGKLTIETQALNVATLVDSTLSGLLPTALLKQIQVTSYIPDTLPAIDGDPKRLQQVLSNVISNAIKFTPEHGQVRVSCAVTATCCPSRSATRASASLPSCCRTCSTGSVRATADPRGCMAASDWDWRSRATSSSVMAGRSRRTATAPGHGTTFVIRLPVPLTERASRPGAGTPDRSRSSCRAGVCWSLMTTRIRGN